ncbi:MULTISPECIES: DUF998 domain-containing protein [Enterococcus]|uniref:DUF998 domain-containing protein n=1 Tax=Candidatus Enterococcus mangumiae TaxID=2230878 RepID=A0ABZ2SWE7_9ENTE|nr:MULTISPECIES: DUF998 domain-containing protein [unclassified Enterococcus]MBO0460273.1 DUF998 domain-containing protein [Enterococcus sp. DIV1298c]MBO0490269.1 DUF998 domain-containing protein [Enterococcus sp. DIV1094]MBO1300418.1 DUF998 domain-containing protein [Enterococcus sp. DIV1271a]
MDFLRRYGIYFLFLGVLSDFSTPYVLGLFYPGLDQLTMPISVFGDVASPVRGSFLIFSVISGILFVLSLPALYTSFANISTRLAKWLVVSLSFYAIGDCLFTGLFSLNTQATSWDFSSWVHNIGSSLGYTGFLLFPVFALLLYRKEADQPIGRSYVLVVILSLLSALIYGLARIPVLNHLPILDKLGFCQRLSYFFNYLAILLVGIKQLKRVKR